MHNEVIMSLSASKRVNRPPRNRWNHIPKFLTDEGFCYEVSDKNSKYSLFLDEYETFDREDEINLLGRIRENPNPIVRYWRWPSGMRSAFVTSHDLDSVTLTDFVLRLLGR